MKVQLDNGELIEVESETVKVIIEGKTDKEENECQIHFTFSSEGLITDVIDSNGEVICTTCEEYEPIIDIMIDVL